MKSFDEVLKKHFTDFYDEWVVRDTGDSIFTYAANLTHPPYSVKISVITPCELDWLPLQSFQSPEKLDIFLTLLFEVN